MLAAEAAAKKAAEEQQKQQEVQKNNASADSNVNTNDVYEGGVFTWPCPPAIKLPVDSDIVINRQPERQVIIRDMISERLRERLLWQLQMVW